MMLAAIALISIPLIFALACVAISEAIRINTWGTWAATVIVLVGVCALWYQMACAVRLTREQAGSLARDILDKPQEAPRPKMARDTATGTGVTQ